MKAAVLHEINQPLSLESVPNPTPGPHDALIKVEACGVCHSDLHLAAGDWPQAIARRVKPTILGHEVVGQVMETGKEVKNFAPGDRVGMGWLCSTCGTCEPCRTGDENICLERQITGVAIQGGFAEYFCGCATHLVPVPAALPAAEAAPLFCAGVTVHRSLRQAAVQPGWLVAVFGVGGLGHLAVQLIKQAGAKAVAVDVSPEKLALATALGADHVFSADAAVDGLQSLGGVQAAIVTCASKAAYDAAFRCLRKKGTLMVVGLPNDKLTFFARDMVMGEFKIMGSAVGTRADIRAVLELASKQKVKCQVQTAKLEEINEIFDQMREGTLPARTVVTF